MELQHFKALRNQIMYMIPEIKYVALFNNQFSRANGDKKDGRKERAFSYPCVLIQYHSPVFSQLSLGVQEFDIKITLHLGVKSFETDDISFLDLKERLYFVVQRFQEGNWARMDRREEEWDYDYDDVNVLKMEFQTHGKDYARFVYGKNELGVITGITETVSIVNSIALSAQTGTFENGTNIWVPPTDNC